MVLDTARPKYNGSTTWLGMRGRDAVKKSTLKVNFAQVFTIHFSEIQFIVKCMEWDELAKEDHTYHLTSEEKKRYQGQWYLTLNKSGKNVPMRLRSDFRALNKAGKNGPMKLRSDFRAAVLMKNCLHH